jgi:hypothetical protein
VPGMVPFPCGWVKDVVAACLRSVKMSYLNGSVNLSSPQRFVVQI